MWWNKKEEQEEESVDTDYYCGCNKDDVCKAHFQLAQIGYNNAADYPDRDKALKRIEHLMRKRVVECNNRMNIETEKAFDCTAIRSLLD